MAVTTTNLGVITAYGDAVAAGYTGTKAEWQALMASYATVGQQAVDAKNDAVAAKNTAVSKATEATTAANTATTKANEASASAQSIAESAAQIAQNTSDISELKEDLTTLAPKEDMLKAFPTDTASGAVANFSDGANVPVKSLIVNIDFVQSGSGDPSPDNVRPISGWDAVRVVQRGKNLLDNLGVTRTFGGLTYTVNEDKSVSVSGTASNTTYFVFTNAQNQLSTYSDAVLKKGMSIIASIGDSASNVIIGARATDGEYITLTKDTAITLTKDIGNVYVQFPNGSTVNETIYPMIRVSSDNDNTYEPYSGKTFNFVLDETVYSGVMDVINGKLTINKAVIDLGTVDWAMATDYAINRFNAEIPNIRSLNTPPYTDIVCSIYKSSNAPISTPNTANLEIAHIGKSVYISDGNYSDASAFKTAMNGVQLLYPLAEPIEIDITSEDIVGIYGSNNIWADTGDTAVGYRADPTLYIQRLTEPDADMIADANITSGQYFMVGNTLYKATANIASGATISPNVNCTRKSLSEALNELNA